MKGISLVAVDLDGTLLTSQRTVALQGGRLLRGAHQKGVHVVLSTTRNPDSALAFWRPLEIDDPIICTNGAQVWGSPGGPVWARHTFSREIGLALAEWADERGWELSTTVEPTKGAAPTEDVGPVTYWRQRPGQPLGPFSPHVTVVSSNVEGVVGDPLRVLVSQGEALDTVRSLCEGPFAGRCRVEVYAGADGAPHSVGVFAPGATKGAGLALVMERLGIARDQILAIGDNACDLRMFPHARLCVVMENAPQDVKREAFAMGAVIAPGNDDEGVAWALKQFVL
jgi:hydroxymethylpyrimidine pyrophosphatase-like HAD family hydrolase